MNAIRFDQVVKVFGPTWSEEVAPVELPAAVEGPLAWALREGVTNVIRHSAARRCQLSVGVSDRVAQVTVLDDGPGAARSAGGGPAFGNGLRGLSERLALAGGSLEAGPVAGGGYRLCAAVPRDQSQVFRYEEVQPPEVAGAVEVPAASMPRA